MTHDHHHGGHNPEPESFVALRTKAIESLLIEKGLISSDLVDQLVLADLVELRSGHCADRNQALGMIPVQSTQTQTQSQSPLGGILGALGTAAQVGSMFL